MPVVAATWNQDLTLSGEVTGHMTGIVPDTSTEHSACTGAKPRAGQTWADEFFGLIDSSGNVDPVTGNNSYFQLDGIKFSLN